MSKLARFMWAVLAAGVLTGCEWEGSSDGDSWDETYDWASFSGVYRDPAGQYLVRQFGLATSVQDTDSIGTGDGVVAAFAGVLQYKPIVLGSVSVTDGSETFSDAAGTGTLTGSAGGTGSINYQTGAISVTFFLSPGAGQSIIVTYQYFGAGTSENPQSGVSGGKDIFTFTVYQEGNKLTFVDNNGARYNGSIHQLRTPGGRDPSTVSQPQNGTTANQPEISLVQGVVASFEVSGTSAAGVAVRIVGTLSLNVQGGGTGGQAGAANTVVRSMRGTWMEAGGRTGDIVASTPPVSANLPVNQQIQQQQEPQQQQP